MAARLARGDMSACIGLCAYKWGGMSRLVLDVRMSLWIST